jgi:hypothetical protein
MRNDARPIGPRGSRLSPIDARDSVKHGRESHIVHKQAEERARQESEREERGKEMTMPTGDSTLRTEI